MINNFKKVTIISPHPDDETVAAGGTILRLKDQGSEISCLVVSGHLPPVYPKSSYEITKKESLKAFKKYGIKNSEFLEIPATKVHEKPVTELNNLIFNHINDFKPELLLIPFPDRHIDHKVIFNSSLVASRPNLNFFPKVVLAYETLSETHWNAPHIEPNFIPNFFINISNYINEKIQILSYYKSQIKDNPARSINAVEALAKFRGSQNGFEYAEAFQVIRINL